MKRTISALCLALLSGEAACGGGAPSPAATAHNHSQGAPSIAEATRYRVELFGDDQALGGAAPLVTVVVFGDYACPPCARTWSVLENLVADYGEDLQVVARALTRPGFAVGEEAAEAAWAAGAQGAFWPMHRRLFAATDFSRAAIEGYAKALNLDVARLRDDLDTGAFSGTRARHRREALELGIAFGPVAMVNGRAVVGFHPEAEWHGLIEEEIALARAKIAAGAPREGLHAALVADGVRAPISLDEATQKLRDELLVRAAAELAAEEAASFGGPELGRDVRYQVALGGAAYAGPADAPVVIVAFMDPLCPFCKRSLQSSFAAALQRWPTELRVELRHLPLPIHAAAEGASRAAAAAGRQGRFADFYDALVAETGGELGRSRFAAIAARLGLDEARFLADLEDPSVAAEVAADRELAGAYGLRATPTLFINGRHFSGHLPPERLLAIVDEELAAARAQISSGVERGAAAAALIREGQPIPAADPQRADSPKRPIPE
jgi:protein-disulfide isomerase